MNIILKTSLKNIFGKPLRTMMVVFAIFVCSVSAMLSFDMVSSIKSILVNIFAGVSRADFMVSAVSSVNKELPDGFPESDIMIINGKSEMLYSVVYRVDVYGFRHTNKPDTCRICPCSRRRVL